MRLYFFISTCEWISNRGPRWMSEITGSGCWFYYAPELIFHPAVMERNRWADDPVTLSSICVTWELARWSTKLLQLNFIRKKKHLCAIECCSNKEKWTLKSKPALLQCYRRAKKLLKVIRELSEEVQTAAGADAPAGYMQCSGPRESIRHITPLSATD